MGTNIGICGTGAFARDFIPLFKAHPLVSEIALSDLIPERMQEQAAKHGTSRTFASLDELCASDVDTIAIMTQRQLHGPQALRALKVGKHVYSAVPIGQTVDEIRDIVQAVQETRLIDMVGETSYYYPATIYCRQRFRKGDFGEFVYGEGQYYHTTARSACPGHGRRAFNPAIRQTCPPSGQRTRCTISRAHSGTGPTSRMSRS